MASSTKKAARPVAKQSPPSGKSSASSKSSKSAERPNAFVVAAKNYEDSVNAELAELDKKFTVLCKSIDDEVKRIKLNDADKVVAQLKNCLERLRKGADSIWSEATAKNKFREAYNRYLKDVGAAWNQSTGAEITPNDLWAVLLTIAYVQGYAAYFNSLFSRIPSK